MLYVLSAAQIKQVEARSDALGTAYEVLMEHAALSAFREMGRAVRLHEQTALLFCGSGNNGGDGYELARLLSAVCARVTVLSVGHPKTPLSIKMHERLSRTGVHVLEADNEAAFREVGRAGILVDAVYGTGFDPGKGLPPLVKHLFAEAKEAQGFRISLDIPSGVSSDSGEAAAGAFLPDLTITFGSMKTGMLRPSCRDRLGTLVVTDIGFPVDACTDMADAPLLITEDLIRPLLPCRRPSAHKGDFGRLLCIAGSFSMSGAAVLLTRAALRAGAGLCKLAAPRSVTAIAAAAVWEATHLPLAETEEGQISHHAVAGVLASLKNASAVAIGPGMGQGEDIGQIVGAVLENAVCPVILDADGINALADNIDMIGTCKAELVLTPHPGEMSRLTGRSVSDIEQDRTTAAVSFATDYGVTLVLKGANTVIAAPDGRVFVNITGNPGLARGGSGDVLTGIIASLAAQGLSAVDAAVCGVYLHGLAADKLRARSSMQGMLPHELPEELPLLFHKWEARGDR